jgi:hypothetical protein
LTFEVLHSISWIIKKSTHIQIHCHQKNKNNKLFKKYSQIYLKNFYPLETHECKHSLYFEWMTQLTDVAGVFKEIRKKKIK